MKRRRLLTALAATSSALALPAWGQATTKIVFGYAPANSSPASCCSG